MRLTLDALAVLDAIDRRGSFAAAAEELHRVPSAVTYTLQKLEQDLDVSLFDRSGHRAKLTPAGEKLLRDGRHLLRSAGQLESAVQRMAGGWESELKIAVGELIPLERFFPLCEEFYRVDCGTTLRLGTELLSGTWDALMSGRADLVIGATGEGPAGGGYTSRTLGSMEFVFVVPPAHPLAASTEVLKVCRHFSRNPTGHPSLPREQKKRRQLCLRRPGTSCVRYGLRCARRHSSHND